MEFFNNLLELTEGPVEMLVIDRVEQPSVN